jgi:hypothetical protein
MVMTLSPLSVNGNSHPPIGFVKVFLNYISQGETATPTIICKKHYKHYKLDPR